MFPRWKLLFKMCIEKVSLVSATDAFSPSAKHAANVPSQADKYPSLPLFSFLLFCTFTADFYWARKTFQRSLKALPNDDECAAAVAADETGFAVAKICCTTCIICCARDRVDSELVEA